MKDEEYVLRQENRDRAITARSAHSRRSHCGKGGRVKLPSDYMTKKELNAMNGECETYRLNEPMKWDEWKHLPDDLRIDYIKLIRQKFNAPDTAIAEMLGVHKVTMAREIVQLGIGKGNHSGGGRKWDKEGFLMWVNGVPVEQAELPAVETPVEEPVEVVREIKETTIPLLATCLPKSGEMSFAGDVDEIANTIRVLLCGAKVSLSVCWRVLEEDDG